MIYNKDDLKQKVKEFIESYGKINDRILNKEKDLTELNNELTNLLNLLKDLREKEKKWNQEQASKLKITYQEFTKITKKIAMELNSKK
jgi:hypothetical protein